MGIIRGPPECSECLIRSFPLVVKQCCPLGGDCWLEVCNASRKPVWVLSPSLARGVHGRVVNGDTDEVSSFFSACCGAVPVGLFNGVGDAFAQVCYFSCIDAWVSFQRGTVDTFGFKTYLAAHQRVVAVAVSALVTVGTEDTVEKGFRVITRSSWC